MFMIIANVLNIHVVETLKIWYSRRKGNTVKGKYIKLMILLSM